MNLTLKLVAGILIPSAWLHATAVEDFERLVAQREQNWKSIADCHRRLFVEAAKRNYGNHTAGTLGELSWANREYIAVLVRTQRFRDAASVLKAHVDFCEKEGAGLYGRNDRNWIDFVQLHARVWSEIGYDPLKGRELFYQLTEDSLGYHAFCNTNFWSLNERRSEIGQASWPQVPGDQTTGKCILMDHLGRITSEVDVGFVFPSNEPSLQKRLKGIYQIDRHPIRFTVHDPADLLTRPRHRRS